MFYAFHALCDITSRTAPRCRAMQKTPVAGDHLKAVVLHSAMFFITIYSKKDPPKQSQRLRLTGLKNPSKTFKIGEVPFLETQTLLFSWSGGSVRDPFMEWRCQICQFLAPHTHQQWNWFAVIDTIIQHFKTFSAILPVLQAQCFLEHLTFACLSVRDANN